MVQIAPRTSMAFVAIAAAIFACSGCQSLAPKAQRQAEARSADEPSSVVEASVEAAELPVGAAGVQLVQHEEPGEPPTAGELVRLPEPVTPAESMPESEAARPVEYYVGMAITNHPSVLAARARVTAAAARVPQALALEDPLLSNSFYPISDQALQTAAGRAGNTLSVSQRYPWPEKRHVAAAMADREVRIATAQLDQIVLEVEESVRLAYYELWFAHRAIEITARNRQIASELVQLATARNRTGGSQQDILRAQLQLDALDERLIALRQQRALAEADVAALIQQPSRTSIAPTQEITADYVADEIQTLFDAAVRCSPELREGRWAVARDRQKQQLACLSRYPDFVLGAGWQTMTESDAVSPVANGHDNVNFMVGVTLPIYRDKINASVREASADMAATYRELSATRDETFRQVRRLAEQAYAAEEQLRLYEKRILPRAQRALQLAAADYRGQLVDFGEVANGFTEVLMFELQVARTRATLAGTIAELHRVIGCAVAVNGTDATNASHRAEADNDSKLSD